MMIKYPLYFKAQSQSPAGIQTQWTTSVSPFILDLACAIPPEFEGPGNGYSPEDFFLLAATNCFIATFKVFAEKSRLQYENLTIESQLIMDRNESGIPWMKSVLLRVNLVKPNQLDQAKRLMVKVSQNCFVLNSLKSEKTFELAIDQIPFNQ